MSAAPIAQQLKEFPKKPAVPDFIPCRTPFGPGELLTTTPERHDSILAVRLPWAMAFLHRSAVQYDWPFSVDGPLPPAPVAQVCVAVCLSLFLVRHWHACLLASLSLKFVTT